MGKRKKTKQHAPVPSQLEEISEERKAFHEAGHAVICCLLRRPFKWVSIERDSISEGRVVGVPDPRGETKGFVETKNGKFILKTVGIGRQRKMEKTLFISLAGYCAEAVLYAEPENMDGNKDDQDVSFELAIKLQGDEAAAIEYIHSLQFRLFQVMMDSFVFRAVTAVAEKLLREKRLSAKAVRKLVRDCKEPEDEVEEYKKLLGIPVR
jgi:hypothetical protein